MRYENHLRPQGPEDLALRTMFAARKRVFIDLLKWDLPALAGEFEIDQFDDPSAEYLILVDEDGAHRASSRLLRADGPHILADHYPFLCAGPVPRAPTTREITRFCLDPAFRAPDRRRARNQLVTVLAEHALQMGITDYTGVANRAWYQQIEGFGWNCRQLGEPVTIGAQDLVGLHIRIDEQTLAGLKANGVYAPLTFRLAATEARHAAS